MRVNEGGLTFGNNINVGLLIRFRKTIYKNNKKEILNGFFTLCPNFISLTLFNDEIKINMADTVGSGLTFD